MARFGSLFFGLVAALFVSASPAARGLQPTPANPPWRNYQRSANRIAQNPLIFELTLDSVTSTAGINDTVYATFNHTFAKPVVGAIASLDIIPLGYLDLLNVDINIRALTINGKLGIPLVISGLHQKNVSTTYDLALS
ncbi:hypothetical protein R3P38DRAFT_2956584 [Favolaschia claudopus]|uniref:Uncharacterized protein n=1 Tax=Favolaschia claudopus TaxID=2862362 RepID=A0AAW0BCC6_9AGAR